MVTRRQFYHRLGKHQFEDAAWLQTLPRQQDLKAGDHVVVLLSGGIDSLVMAAFLIETYKVVIHPVYVRQLDTPGTGRAGLAAVTHAANWLRHTYPAACDRLYSVNGWSFDARSLYGSADALVPELFNLKQLVAHIHEGKLIYPLVPMRLFLYPMMGAIHCRYLSARLGLAVRQIALGILPTDGLTIPGQTLTTTRIFESFVRHVFMDKTYRLSTPFFDDTRYTWMDKQSVVAWGVAQNLPVAQTWSCTERFIKACGECNPCLSRKVVFDANGITEPHITRRISGLLVNRGLGLGLMPQLRSRSLRILTKLGDVWERMASGHNIRCL